jgi:hypothetical protein
VSARSSPCSRCLWFFMASSRIAAAAGSIAAGPEN